MKNSPHKMTKGKWEGRDHWTCTAHRCVFDTFNEEAAREHEKSKTR